MEKYFVYVKFFESLLLKTISRRKIQNLIKRLLNYYQLISDFFKTN